MARRRIWRNKPEAEKERRRALEKQKIRSSGGEKISTETKVSDIKPDPKTKARYLALSPMMKETVDGLVAGGLSMEKVINGLRS